MNVYIVCYEDEQHNDYGIEAVFSTREKAASFAKMMQPEYNFYHFFVEAYTVDDKKPPEVSE